MAFALRVIIAGLIALAPLSPSLSSEIKWQSWSDAAFETAKKNNKFVLLDLEAVWCHWCHVMHDKTYGDPRVQKLLKSKFVTVRVDQDANPDLSRRYGDWGWPATIVFSADGEEIVKRRGYIPPDFMVSMLKAIIDDPSPGPSVIAEKLVVQSKNPYLSDTQRADLLKRSDDFYDETHGGWGKVHKFIDVDSMDLAIRRARSGNDDASGRARTTLTAAINLIDPVAGGIYQYSDALDWQSPHYEKIMWYQAHGLRQYAQGYLLWQDEAYLDATNSISDYLLNVLQSPDGAFYTSQDADAGKEMSGDVYYSLSQEERDQVAVQPSIDRNKYARENGWAIQGLTAHYAATGEEKSLKAALAAANWVLKNRSLATGGFRHGDNDRGGPFLGDTLAMGQAALDLYAATGDRKWLRVATKAGDFITANFQDEEGGFLTSATPEAGVGVLKEPVKALEEQVRVTRFANMLHHYIGDKAYKDMAQHGARYITSDVVLGYPRPLPGVLLATEELRSEPVHITIVGHKDNKLAQKLHAAGRKYPGIYKRLDWWDKREGPLPNPDITYPELETAAAFACTERICSLPVTEPEDLPKVVEQMMSGPKPGGKG